MNVSTQASIQISAPMAAVFATASSTEGLPKIFPGSGPIPGVVSAEMIGGGEPRLGSVRRVKLTDGSEVEEAYIEFDPPNRYAYQMSKFKAPLSLLMTVATGRWILTSDGAGGTRVDWTYTCQLTTPLAAILAAPVVKIFMKRSMDETLRLIKASL